MEFEDLVGKTIKSIVKREYSTLPDKGFLDVTFFDGTKVTIVVTYNNQDNYEYEYPTDIFCAEYGFEFPDD